LLLQLPPGTSTALIADRRPPEVAASTSVGVSDDLRAASSLRSSGGRATSDALTLAVQQLPARPAARRVIVLYTAAPTAGGEPATVLAERLRTAGTIVAVVTTSGDDAYWPTVARLTGGMAIATPPGRSLEAFDAVADALGRRYTVTFSHPPAGVTRVGLRVEADGGPVLVDVDLPVARVPSSGTGSPTAGEAGSGYLWAGLVAGLFLAVMFGAALRSRRRAGRAGLTPVPPGPPREPSLFDEAVAAGPTGPDHERDLATEYQRLAGHDRAEGRLALAASGYRQAVDALGQRVELEPGNPAFQYDLATAVTELAELDADQGWIAQAAAGYQRAIELGERLVLAHPGNPDYRRTLDLARARAAALEQGASARSAFPDADADRRRRWTFRITRR
ncbi:MAG: hypothetical protein WAL50_08780, partial [Kineosporiaceae bacterium]